MYTEAIKDKDGKEEMQKTDGEGMGRGNERG